jgi:glycosyltransferase involved in cell wall biosynthesis
VAQAAAMEVISRRVSEFDVIHCHGDWSYLPLLTRLGVPFLATLHGRLDLPGLSGLIDMFSQAPFVSISNNQRGPLPQARWLATIYHGLPTNRFRFRPEGGTYLAFLGRLAPEKGPEVAIRIANAADIPLRIAAKVPRGETRYFEERLQPQIDGKRIELIGEVNDRQKEGFLAGAAALIFPIDWPEPFGLVMIEAMACGTPVIAFRRGSVPEVIEHGLSGFIVDNEAEAVDAVRRLGELDRRQVRQAFERRFTADTMAAQYFRCYQAIVGSHAGDSTIYSSPVCGERVHRTPATVC